MIKKIMLLAVALPVMLFSDKGKTFEFQKNHPLVNFLLMLVITQTIYGEVKSKLEGLAIQGGFDYSVSLVDTYIDAYVGTWAANLNTNGFGMELDYYGGFTGAIPALEDYFSYDIGMLYYDYPGASSQDSDGNGPDGGSGTQGLEFLEWYGSVGISGLPADLGLSYYFGYSPTGFNNNYDYTYHNVGAELLFLQPLSLYMVTLVLLILIQTAHYLVMVLLIIKLVYQLQFLDWIGELNLRRPLAMRLLEKTKMIPLVVIM